MAQDNTPEQSEEGEKGDAEPTAEASSPESVADQTLELVLDAIERKWKTGLRDEAIRDIGVAIGWIPPESKTPSEEDTVKQQEDIAEGVALPEPETRAASDSIGIGSLHDDLRRWGSARR
jgi:hypothetical protein